MMDDRVTIVDQRRTMFRHALVDRDIFISDALCFLKNNSTQVISSAVKAGNFF